MAVRPEYLMNYQERLARLYRRDIVDGRYSSASEHRALRLLEGELDKVQLADWFQHSAFTVATPEHRYRVYTGRVQNVLELADCGCAYAQWCVTSERGLPVCDILLAQLCLLTGAETRFRKIGHATYLAPCKHQRGFRAKFRRARLIFRQLYGL